MNNSLHSSLCCVILYKNSIPALTGLFHTREVTKTLFGRDLKTGNLVALVNEESATNILVFNIVDVVVSSTEETLISGSIFQVTNCTVLYCIVVLCFE